MLSAIEQFRENILRVRNLGALHQAIDAMTTAALDPSDLLRAQYVLAVSALDHYIHEVTRTGMLEIFDGTRGASPAYLRFRVSLDSVTNGASNSALRANLDAEIRTQHSYLAFQHPGKIADAIRLFSEIDLWDNVARRLGIEKRDLKEHLRLIVDRRNKIAHEADLDPTYPNTRWPISAQMVGDVVDFINSLAESIYMEVELRELR